MPPRPFPYWASRGPSSDENVNAARLQTRAPVDPRGAPAHADHQPGTTEDIQRRLEFEPNNPAVQDRAPKRPKPAGVAPLGLGTSPVVATSHAPIRGSSASVYHRVQGSSEPAHSRAPAPVPTPTPAPPPVEILPQPGKWIQYFDPSSGKPYYYNPAIKKTLWDDPTPFALPSPPPAQQVQSYHPQPHPKPQIQQKSADIANAPPPAKRRARVLYQRRKPPQAGPTTAHAAVPVPAATTATPVATTPAQTPTTMQATPSPPSKPAQPSAATTTSGSVAPSFTKLSDWGLADVTVEAFNKRKITGLFPWQAECLGRPGVSDKGKSIVYCAPTSGGKTLVAEMLMLLSVQRLKKRAIFLLPYKAIVEEKAADLRLIFKTIGAKVAIFHGGTDEIPDPGWSVGVCTMEKGHSLFSKMVEESKLHELGILVIDEAHMIGEKRGYQLEAVLSKLMFLDQSRSVQVVAMSATLPNVGHLADWLGAELYITADRPVPLREYLKIRDQVNENDKRVCALPRVDGLDDKDHVAMLSYEVACKGRSVIVFCHSKDVCEKCAEKMASNFEKLDAMVVKKRRARGADVTAIYSGAEEEGGGVPPGWYFHKNLLGSHPPLANAEIISKRQQVLQDLRHAQGRVHAILLKTIPFGVAFHHGGLTTDERRIVEQAYRTGVVSVITATSTVAAGVNLPCQRVLFRAIKAMKPMSRGITKEPVESLVSMYRQMCGRAGRTGIDSFGESILLCTSNNEVEYAKTLMAASLPEVTSSMDKRSGALSMTVPLLDAIALNIFHDAKDMLRFINCTFYHHQIVGACDQPTAEEGKEPKKLGVDPRVGAKVKAAFNFLLKEKFVTSGPPFAVTKLGLATNASKLDVMRALLVSKELQEALEIGLIMKDDLHLIYHITPIDTRVPKDYAGFMHDNWNRLPTVHRAVAKAVGVSEQSFYQLHRRPQKPQYPLDSDEVPSEDAWALMRHMLKHQRFVNALALNQLLREVSLEDVKENYEYRRIEDVRALQEQASQFCGILQVFCDKLGFERLKMLFKPLGKQLKSAVKPDIVHLVGIPNVRAARARLLFNGGYRTIKDVADAEADAIADIISTSQPYGQDVPMNMMSVAAKIVSGAKKMMADEAKRLRIKAESDPFAADDSDDEQMIFGQSAVVEGPKMGKTMAGFLTAASLQESQSSRTTHATPAHPLNSLGGTDAVSSKSAIAAQGPVGRVLCANVRMVLVGAGADIEVETFLELWRKTKGPFALKLGPPKNFAVSPVKKLEMIVDTVCITWEANMVYVAKPDMVEVELRRQLENPKRSVAMFDCQSTCKVFLRTGVRVLANLFDPLVAVWVLDPDKNSQQKKRFTLSQLVDAYLAVSARIGRASSSHGAEGSLAADCLNLYRLQEPMNKRLQEVGSLEGFRDVEMPMQVELACLEVVGVGLDRKYCSAIKVAVDRRVTELDQLASEMAGQTMNTKSPKQVGSVLFVDLQLPGIGPNQNKESDFSSKKEALEPIAHLNPLPDVIMEIRALRRIHANCNDYEGQVKQHLHVDDMSTPDGKNLSLTPQSPKEDHPRMHPTWSSINSATGRLTVDNPNVQCIEKEIHLQTVGMKKWVPLPALSQWSNQQLEQLFSHGGERNSDLVKFVGMTDPQSAVQVPEISASDREALMVEFNQIQVDLAKKGGVIDSNTGLLQGRVRVIRQQLAVPSILDMRQFGYLTQITASGEAMVTIMYPRSVIMRPLREVHILWGNPSGPEDPYHMIGPLRLPSVPSRKLALRNVITARQNHKLISCDYAQAEYRVFAHLSGDGQLIEQLNDVGKTDLFTSLASKWLRKPPDIVDKHERAASKQVLYKYIYGGGFAHKDSRVRDLRDRFPGIETYRDKVLRNMNRVGFVTTITGRKRYLVKGDNNRAINTLCQASAADVIKMAQLRVRLALEAVTVYAECKRTSSTSPPVRFDVGKDTGRNVCAMGLCQGCGRGGAVVVLQIHDELVLETPKEHVKEVTEAVQKAMEQCDLHVRMQVNTKVDSRWGVM